MGFRGVHFDRRKERREISPKQRMNSTRGFLKTLIFTAAAAAAVLCLCLFMKPARTTAAVASEGKIYLENIDVTGMSYDEVQAVITDKMNIYLNNTIEIYADNATAYIDAAEMGLYYENTDLPEIISSMGMNGNVLARYNIDNYINQNGAIFFSLDLRVDPGMVYNVVEAKVAVLDRQPVNMKLGRYPDGSFTILPKEDGFHVLIDETVEGLTEYMNTSWHGGIGGYRAEVEVEEAIDYPGLDVEQMTSLLGTGVTEYEISGKYESRAANIANATSKINGTIVYPGEVFSTEQLMVPFTEENGYQYAAGYENGYVVDTIGGGICQVSSTLYRAVLEAELDVVERYQHSMSVGYVEPSMDATIAEDSLDFKFMNSTDTPIYIEGVTNNGTLVFNIYGHETRDPGRRLEFESEVYDYVPAETTIVMDPNMDYGTYDLENGHDGYSAKAYKIVYQNNEVIERVQISSSTYVVGNGTLTVGIKGAPDGAVEQMTAAQARGNVGEMFLLSGLDVWGGTEGATYELDQAIAFINDVENGGDGTGTASQTSENGQSESSEGSSEGSSEEGGSEENSESAEEPAEEQAYEEQPAEEAFDGSEGGE